MQVFSTFCVVSPDLKSAFDSIKQSFYTKLLLTIPKLFLVVNGILYATHKTLAKNKANNKACSCKPR